MTIELNTAQDVPPDGPMDEDDIVSILRQKREQALNREDGDLSDIREKAVGYYSKSTPIGIEDPERSTYRSSEIFEAIEWAMPSIMSVFFSAKQPIVFEPVKAEDVKQAEQETDAVNYYLFQKQNSYLQFHHFFKSALLDPNAYAKVHVVKAERTIMHRYERLTDQQLVEVMRGRTFRNYSVEPQLLPGIDGLPVRYHKFKGMEVKMEEDFIFEAIPPENLLVERAADYLDLDEVFDNHGMICHISYVSHSDLLARGYDADKLEEVPDDSDEDRESGEKQSRKYREDEHARERVSDYAGRMYKVYEHYLKLDVDGDEVSEGRKIVVIGDTIFEDEPCDYMPIVATSVIPMPFKHAGISLAESLFTQQELSTKLWRMLLDNLYNTTPKYAIDRRLLSHNKGTMDSLRDPEDQITVVNGDPNSGIRQIVWEPITEPILATHQRVEDGTKRLSGIAPDNALNPDVIRDATAHGMLASMDKNSQRLMHIVRTLAETGVKKIAKKMHQLLRMYANEPLMLQLRGEFVEVDPTTWIDRPNVKVTVGLGFNSKEQRLSALMNVLGLQKEALGQGGASPEHIAHTLSELLEAGDLGFLSQFFNDPAKQPWQPPPPQPDPNLLLQKEIEDSKKDTKLKELEVTERRAEMEMKAKMAEVEANKAKIAAEVQKMEFEDKREDVFLLERRRAEVEELVAKRDKLLAEVDEIRARIGKIRAEASKTAAEATAVREGGPEENEDEGKED